MKPYTQGSGVASTPRATVSFQQKAAAMSDKRGLIRIFPEEKRLEWDDDADAAFIAKGLSTDAKPGRLLKLAEVEQKVGLKKSAIYARIKEGTFPANVQLKGTTAKRWREEDIDAWLRQHTL